MVDSNIQDFLDALRVHLVSKRIVGAGETELRQLFYASSLPQTFWGAAVALYQKSMPRILVVRATSSPSFLNIRQALNQTQMHERFEQFDLENPESCSLQFDLIEREPEMVDLTSLSDSARPDEHHSGSVRFEIGVDGLRIVANGKRRYLMPGDGFVRSLLGMNQLRRHIARLFPGEDIEKLSYYRFQSISFVSTATGWSRLFRGLPVTPTSSTQNSVAPVIYAPPARAVLLGAAEAGVRWIADHQLDSGRFFYYYDAATDSRRDHEHPGRDPDTNPYYNVLRHCGGVLTLLFSEALRRAHQLPPVQGIRNAVEEGIDFYIKQLVKYRTANGEEAAYAYFNRKAKLGGSGIGLYMLASYQQLFDDRYAQWARLVARHLASEIQASGEFMYYHVYLDKKVDADANEKLFSFYYPGEAVIGLAAYCRHVSTSADETDLFYTKLRTALRFLFTERPRRYAAHYQSLPADSWLMMAVNDLWDIQGFRQELYRESVFQDADQMVSHQYTESDALYPDYVGSFYYEYGDHAYPDGARAEGLLGAYMLALKLGDGERIARYRQAIDRVAWATLRLCNTSDSVYSVPNPGRSIGGIRFKLTRQWFRVDTIQHVASFYLKLLRLESEQ